MPDPRELAKDAEKRVTDPIEKVDPTKPHTESGPHGPPPPTPPEPDEG